MAAGDNRKYVTVTLPASKPGKFASVKQNITGVAATDLVVATISGTKKPVNSVGESFNIYVEKVEANYITITANKMQTPEVKVNVLVVQTA